MTSMGPEKLLSRLLRVQRCNKSTNSRSLSARTTLMWPLTSVDLTEQLTKTWTIESDMIRCKIWYTLFENLTQEIWLSWRLPFAITAIIEAVSSSLSLLYNLFSEPFDPPTFWVTKIGELVVCDDCHVEVMHGCKGLNVMGTGPTSWHCSQCLAKYAFPTSAEKRQDFVLSTSLLYSTVTSTHSLPCLDTTLTSQTSRNRS